MSPARFVVTPLAQADIESARFWYETQQAGLGQRFLKMLRETFVTVSRIALGCPTEISRLRIGLAVDGASRR